MSGIEWEVRTTPNKMTRNEEVVRRDDFCWKKMMERMRVRTGESARTLMWNCRAREVSNARRPNGEQAYGYRDHP